MRIYGRYQDPDGSLANEKRRQERTLTPSQVNSLRTIGAKVPSLGWCVACCLLF
ncbi:hypothetical protein [Bacillus sp. AG4(2022)]|uniref:hypothetical protein n=1 Tax=Bacillus sp. AG4(2022) TaxID=2962594 RepID=UPI002882CD6C|nr:hypothetical protein [Bacillus sp. AG4(2022)]MDT0161860.1 hypothetical protein [Bacillus sp. AG4(2022)]